MNVLRSGLMGTLSSALQLTAARSVLYEQVRGNVRWYFEKCSEVKRIRKFGYKKRISTAGGRQVIMRRILKGKHVLTH